MAKARELWDSKVGIPSQRRTAPQINPGVARMFPTTGLEKVGGAITGVGEEIHQVNVARQVASAVAQYKMASADFLARMQNADPSKVDFGQEFQKFAAQQGGLAFGVSRDASNIISNKIKQYSASTYGDVKRMEVRNTRNMALAEIPDIIDNLTREQAQAEAVGDTERANRAATDLVQILRGYGPAIRPWEKVKIQGAVEDAILDARHNVEKEAIVGAILYDSKAAQGMIDKSKYQTNSEKLTLTKQANAASVNKVKRTIKQKNAFKDSQSSVMMKQFRETGEFLVPTDIHDDLIPIVDAYSDMQSSSLTNAMGDENHPTALKLDDTINMKLTPVSDTELWEAGTLLNEETRNQLQDDNEQTKKLQKNIRQVRNVMKQIDAHTNNAMAVATEMDITPATLGIIHEQLEDERTLLMRSAKEQFIAGDDPKQIVKAIDDIFKASIKNILEGNVVTRRVKDLFGSPLMGLYDSLEDNPEAFSLKQKRRAMISLLMSKNYDSLLEAIVTEAKWFKPGEKTLYEQGSEMAEAPPDVASVRKVSPESPTGYVPFAMDGKYYAAPKAVDQSDSDAMLSGIDSNDLKEFGTIEEVEKFTGKKIR